MRAMITMLIMLSLCIHVVPIEEWDAMSKPEKRERLKQGIEMIKQELGCDNPKIAVDFDPKFMYMLGECDNGRFVAHCFGITQQ